METINQLVLHHSTGTDTYQLEDSTKVSFDAPQDLTDAQKAQARQNIGVAEEPAQLRGTTRAVTPLVTFMDDDGRVEVMSKLKPLSQAYGIPFVAAIITNTLVPENTAHLNAEDVLELQAMGWEIASHTMSHPQLGSLTDEQQEAELAGSKNALESIGIQCSILAYPGSNTNENTWRIAQKYYRAGRQTDWRDHLNNSPLETWDLRVVAGFDAVSDYSEYPSDTDPLVYCKAMVDKAVAEKAWVIFLTHAEELTETGLSNLRETIEYVQSLNIPIVTISQALDIRGNMIDIGRYNRKVQRDYPETYAEHFTVGCDGSLAHKDNDKYLAYLPQNSVTSATPPKDFPRYAISSCRITYTNTDGFPSANGGTLLTNTLGSRAYDYSEGRAWQELILPISHISWKRYALSDTQWSAWSDDGHMILAENSVTVDSAPKVFPQYMRSKVYLLTGLDNVPGWLITDRTGNSGAFTTQVFVPLNYWRSNGGMFYRAADSNTQWGAWTCLGERVTSNANFLASATSLKYPGACVFDTTRGKPVWYNGTNWVDATGTVVV